MKILIWPGHHDCLDAAIKCLTHGQGSHAAFLRSDDERVHEAFWPRVRTRPLTDEDRAAAEVYRLEGVSDRQHAQFEWLFDSNDLANIEYSIADLFRFALNLQTRDEKHTFCSRYVMHCLQEVLQSHYQMPLVRLPDRDWASPRDLRISPKLTLLRGYFRANTRDIFD